MSERAFIFDGQAARRVDRDAASAAIGVVPLVWVHLDGNEPGSAAWLAQRELDGLVIRALLARETRPRLDVLDGGALLNLRGPDANESHNHELLASVRLWIAPGWVVSVTYRELSALGVTEAAFATAQVRDPGDLVCILATAVTDELDPDVAGLGDTIDDCETMFGAANALQLRGTITRARAAAIAYRRFLAPQRATIERLVALDVPWLDDDDRLHLREAADRAARMAEELEAIRERAALVHEQLTDLRAEMIDTRSLVISIVALVFLPLTFLTGLLGMNVDGIPYAHQPWAFWGVVGVCVAIAVGVAAYFIRARWFR